MKKIRLGNDIQFNWSLFNSEGEPYNIEGADLRITYTTFRGVTEVTDFSVSENVVSWTFKGKDQKVLGDYIITLQKNAGEDGMITIDKCSAFRLVARSCDTGGEDTCSHLKVETVELQSEVDGVIVDPVIPEIGENGNWFVNGKDTGKPSKGEDGKAFTYDDFTPEQIEELQKPATDAADSLLQLEKAIESAEQSRVLAENNRNESELLREQSEQGRKQAETERSSAETQREENESKRLTAEQARIQAESARSTAEQDRVSNEQSRVSAEEDRVAEETKRSEAESQRAQAETKRAEAETARVLAETKRSEAEASRVSAETARVSAEETRVTEFEQLKQDSQTAIDNANKSATSANDAANKANEVAESVESRLSQVYANYDAIVSSGETDQNKIYIDAETDTTYRFNGTDFVSIGGGININDYEEIKGLKSSAMIVDIGSDNIDYINSLSCLSLLFYVKSTENTYTDWYRYIRIIDIENGGYNSEDNRPIISFNFDGGIYIFGSGQDFNHKIKGYKNLISINRIDGKAIGYSEMGKDFDEQLDRFKQNTFFPNHSNGQKPNGFRISTGDRKTFLYEWILFNFDIERLCRFNTVLLDFMRNRTAPGLIESCFIHKDKSIRVYEKYKPNTYQQLVLTQDEDGYYIGSTDSIDKYFIINRSHYSSEDIAYDKACEVKNVIQVISGSIKLSTVTVNTIQDAASLYKIKNIDTGEEIESTEELGEGTYEIIVDNLYLNRYGTSFKVISPCTIRFITETITPYSCIYQLKFDRLYKGDKVINGVNNELIPIKTYDSNSPLTPGFVQFDSSEFKSIGPNRSPRFIGEKWYNTATGDIYEAGDLTSFKKINS